MNSQWKSYLESLGATVDEVSSLVTGLGTANQDPNQQTVLCDLSQLGIIRVRGADAQTFLQGQTTNDIKKLDDTHGQLNGYCSPKGRLLAIFSIIMREDSYYLLVERSVFDAVFKRLKMFILMSKVEMSDVSDEWILSGIVGPAASELIDKAGLPRPAEVYAIASDTHYSVMALPGTAPRYLVLSGPEKAQGLWDSLADNAKPAAMQTWRLTDIRAAIPTVYSDTVEAFVPQMVNMQLLEGVSFKKGCYTGQEVVARMQYLGKLKRRMYRAQLATADNIGPGTPLYAQDSTSGQGAGKVVDIQPSPGGGYELLAVIEIASAEQGALVAGTENGPALQLLPLPYEIEPAS